MKNAPDERGQQVSKQIEAQRKELMAEMDLAQQAFAESHAQLKQSLRATEKGLKPARPLTQALEQHFTAASILLAVGRALARVGRNAKAAAKKQAGHHARKLRHAATAARKPRTPAYA
jgi:hypothetical protein